MGLLAAKLHAPTQQNRAFIDQVEAEIARRKAQKDLLNNALDYNDENGGEDPKLAAAILLFIETQTASTALLQRRLGIGYSRASKIIDYMETLGLITPAEGNKPRKVSPTAKEYLEKTFEKY